MRIKDYELIDHGIENCQYFQGCGTSWTDYDECDTGIGSNFAEAYDDCCEMIAQRADVTGDWEAFDKRVLKDIGRRKFPRRPAITSKHNEDCYYHVSIRYTLEPDDLLPSQPHMAAIPATEKATD